MPNLVYICVRFVSKLFVGNFISKHIRAHLFEHIYIVSSIANTNNSK